MLSSSLVACNVTIVEKLLVPDMAKTNTITTVLSRKRNRRCATLVYLFFAQLAHYSCTELLFFPTTNSRGSEYTPVFDEWYFCSIFF